jgi:hypothetical protein
MNNGNVLKNCENSSKGLYAHFLINDLIVSNHPDLCQHNQDNFVFRRLNSCNRISHIPLIIISGKICCDTGVSAGDSPPTALGQYSAKVEDDYSVYFYGV